MYNWKQQQHTAQKQDLTKEIEEKYKQLIKKF